MPKCGKTDSIKRIVKKILKENFGYKIHFDEFVNIME